MAHLKIISAAACFSAFLVCHSVPAAGEPPANLALSAHATAFESDEDHPPDQANDGKPDTRWSNIPGHDTGGWYELDWEQPVRISEVITLQYDRYVKEMDLQVWDETAAGWRTVAHEGKPSEKLPKVIVSRFDARETTKLRLANMAGGPSFTEVQVYALPYLPQPEVCLASDANGNFIGLISDGWGSSPVPGADVSLSGESKAGAWHATARSDEHGLFTAPMPLGLMGRVSVSAHLAQEESSPIKAAQIKATDFQYGLTPQNLRRQQSSLDGLWRFAVDPPADFPQAGFDDSHWAEIRTPSHFMMEGFQSPDGIGGYRRHFRAPGGQGRIKLRFDGVYSGAEVWVNGLRVAYHEGGALPFEVDVTDAVKAGDNVIAVRVAEHTTVSDHLDHMSYYADFPLTGIMRPAYLFRTPEAHIGALQVSTAFDSIYSNATFLARVSVINESSEALADAAVELRLIDAGGETVPAQFVPQETRLDGWSRAELSFSATVTAPKKWDAEHPNLYTLEVTLKSGKKIVDKMTQHVGFRQTEIVGGELRVNGRAIKIRGTCHHDADPLLGRAVTAELEREDVRLAKEANLNSFRTSHYPPLPALLDAADEMGLYMESEGSFCWADSSDDVRVTPRILQMESELLARDRNHPSVFMWSVANESHWGFGMKRAHEWMRRADPTRPCAGSHTRNSVELDVRHNPINLKEMEELSHESKPLIWDECWCVFQGIWGDSGEMWVDPGIRDYYAVPLPPIYAKMMQTTNVVGTQIWAWSDDLFCVPNRGMEYGRHSTPCRFVDLEYGLPNRGIVGDAPWGVVDGWRRRKPEFWITRKLHSPVKIKEGALPVPEAGQPIRVPVENQYDFTDLAELAVTWQLGDERGSVHAAVPPRSTGEIDIKPATAARSGQTLSLTFSDVRGVVDAYRLPLGEAARPAPAFAALAAAPLQIRKEYSQVGDGTRLIGKDFELAFTEGTGVLRRGLVLGRSALVELPKLHVLISGQPDTPFPDETHWQLRSFTIQREGDNVRVILDGHYPQFAGGYNMVLTPSGELTVHSTFIYSGEKLMAREIGLVLAVPKECDQLSWQREGEWSVYPADHIGRTSGQTRAVAIHGDQVPPAWPWAQDNSPMGCNDFRSTKRHIDWASLSCPAGQGVCIESDGSQSLRAEVKSDRIVCHLNDWYGGSHVGLNEWDYNYGSGRPVNPGDKIESNAHLLLGRTAKAAARK